MGEIGKSSFIALPGKGGQSRLMPSRPGDPPWREYGGVIVFRGQDQLMELGWLASRWSFKYQPSGFNQSRVCVLGISSFHAEGIYCL